MITRPGLLHAILLTTLIPRDIPVRQHSIQFDPIRFLSIDSKREIIQERDGAGYQLIPYLRKFLEKVIGYVVECYSGAMIRYVGMF